jgi:cold shock CspA family protein
MDEIQGVSIAVKLNGEESKVQKDGFLGRLVGPSHVDIIVHTARPDIIGLMVGGKKDVVIKKNLASLPLKHYKLRVHIPEEATPHTVYPFNNLRFVEWDMNGMVRIWEVAVISQAGNFFLTIQETYKVCCYRSDDKIICPEFPNWPQMVNFLATLLQEQINNLRTLSEFRPGPRPSTKGLGPKDGLVRWFNFAMGYGAILTKRGVARVYWSNIQRNGRLAYLEPGGMVNFTSLCPPEGETQFKWEAIGVKSV